MIKTGLKQGFTLAEVLTTLMVIGVVAAMTIPTLINSTDDQQHKVALKKGISILSQATQLNTAKEVECTITNSYQLCDCLSKSMQGTCVKAATNVNNAGGNNNDPYVITTPDGMAYTFFFRGVANAAAAGSAPSFSDQCGDDAPKTQDAWAGKGARCVVVIDTNGLTKGSHKVFVDGTYGIGQAADNKLHTIPKADQFPVMLSTNGVYPMITFKGSKYGHLGYDYMYGSGTGVKAPFTIGGSGADKDNYVELTTDEAGDTTTISEANNG